MIKCFPQIHLRKLNVFFIVFEQVAKGTGLDANLDENRLHLFKPNGAISILNVKPIKLVDDFSYLSSNISSTESDDSICFGKAWNAIERLLAIWKFYISDKIKWKFFPAVAVSVLLYNCTTGTLTNLWEKRLNGNYTRIVRAILNKSCKQHPQNNNCAATRPLISQTIH